MEKELLDTIDKILYNIYQINAAGVDSLNLFTDYIHDPG